MVPPAWGLKASAAGGGGRFPLEPQARPVPREAAGVGSGSERGDPPILRGTPRARTRVLAPAAPGALGPGRTARPAQDTGATASVPKAPEESWKEWEMDVFLWKSKDTQVSKPRPVGGRQGLLGRE